MTPSSPARLRDVALFWAPLASTWLMMAIEGPFLAAVIARLDEPKVNLAAYGVAFAIALIVEAPVIMMLSAATALAVDARSFARLRRFAYALNGAVTATMIVLLLPPVFDVWARSMIGLPDEVARRVWLALVILLPWPAAIGYRRLYQGLMIRQGQTRRVMYGTLLRLTTMSATALVLSRTDMVTGAAIGAAALSVAVIVEAIGSRTMALVAVRAVCAEPTRADLSYPEIVRFYTPLALTSIIALAAQPVTTFFMGQAAFPLESLAALPVVISLTFVFRSLGLAFQEVAITFLARDERNLGVVVRFAAGLAVAASCGLAIIAFTPLAHVWYVTVSGLSLELTSFALPPTRILVVLPAMSVLLSLQRSLLVHGRATRPITFATALEMGALITALLVTIHVFGMVGATAAALSFFLGRIASNLYLAAPCLALSRRIISRSHAAD